MIQLLSVPAIIFAFLAYDELFFQGSPKLAFSSFVVSLGATSAIGARWRPLRPFARVSARALSFVIGLAAAVWVRGYAARQLVRSPFVFARAEIPDLVPPRYAL